MYWLVLLYMLRRFFYKQEFLQNNQFLVNIYKSFLTYNTHASSFLLNINGSFPRICDCKKIMNFIIKYVKGELINMT